MISIYDPAAVDRLRSELKFEPRRLRALRTAYFKKSLGVDAALAELPLEVRSHFAERVEFHPLTITETFNSEIDGATKLVLRTPAGYAIETVIMRTGTGRVSLCVSSQVGCAAACAFCATGQMGIAKSLSPAEMLDQIVLAGERMHAEGCQVRNIVFMGMGEPFHNDRAVRAALDVLRDPRAFHLADRHLLVSTVGVVPAMLRFARDYPGVRLALSLHSARQEVRERLMPTAGFHSIDRLRAVLPAVSASGNFMAEVLLLKGVNDGPDDLAALADFLRGTRAHVNLIQFNPFPGAPYEPVSRAAREAFGAALRREGFKVTLRYSLGDDIAAACGQLVGGA